MKCTGWDTRPSRVMPYNGFMCSMLATNNLFLRVQLKASLLISWCYLTKVCSKPSVCCGRVSGTPLWGSESPKFLLGWWRFNIQTFWGYPHWSIPQGYQKEFWYPFWITKPVPKLREMRGLTSVSHKSLGLRKGHKFHYFTGGSYHAAWRRLNTLQLHRYLMWCNVSNICKILT